MSNDPNTTLKELLHHLGFEVAIEEHKLDDQVMLDIKCDDPGRLINDTGCGNTGCLEAYASATNVGRRAREELRPG